MSQSKRYLAMAFSCAAILMVGCQLDGEQQQNNPPPGHTGEVVIGDAMQVVPLFEDTDLTLWDNCGCPPTPAFSPATSQISCGTPGILQDNATITLEMSAPQGSEGTALAVCSLSLTFQMEPMEDPTVVPERREGALDLVLSHSATLDAKNYGLTFEVSLTEDKQEIYKFVNSFCQLESTGVLPEFGIVAVCDEPYAPESDLGFGFNTGFAAGSIYKLEISVSANLGASPNVPDWGGNILFGLDVDNVRIEFD